MKIKSYKEIFKLYFEYDCNIKTLLSLTLLNNLIYSCFYNLNSLNEFVLYSRTLNSGVINVNEFSKTKRIVFYISLYHASTKILNKENIYFKEILKLLFITKKFKINRKNFSYEKEKLIESYKRKLLNAQYLAYKKMFDLSLDKVDSEMLYKNNIKVLKSIKVNDLYDILNNLDKHLFHTDAFNLENNYVKELFNIIPSYKERKLKFEFINIKNVFNFKHLISKKINNSSYVLLYRFDCEKYFIYLNFLNYYLESSSSFIFSEIREKLGLVYDYDVYLGGHFNFIGLNFLINKKDVKTLNKKLGECFKNIEKFLTFDKFVLIRKEYYKFMKSTFKNAENLATYNNYYYDKYFIENDKYVNFLKHIKYKEFIKIIKSLKLENSLFLEGKNA